MALTNNVNNETVCYKVNFTKLSQVTNVHKPYMAVKHMSYHNVARDGMWTRC